MSQNAQRLDDLLADHPPLLEGGTWTSTPDVTDTGRITQGDLLIKGDNATEYTRDSDFSDADVRLVLRADEHGVVYWSTENNAYGYYPVEFLREDLTGFSDDETPTLAHLPYDP